MAARSHATEPDRSQLKRLERLMDVVYAIAIWRVFMLVPRPDEQEWESLSVFFAQEGMALAVLAVGLAVIIVYWIQGNLLLGSLEGTDTRHTVAVILQIFSLLLFLYSIKTGALIGDTPGTRLFESLSALALGLTSYLGWYTAVKDGRLVRKDLSTERLVDITRRIRAEPVTALITIPFAFVGAISWNLAWFAYPLIVYLVRRLPLLTTDEPPATS